MADARMQTAVFLALLGGKIAPCKSSPAVYFIPGLGRWVRWGRKGLIFATRERIKGEKLSLSILETL